MIKTISLLTLVLWPAWASPLVALELPLDAKASSLKFTGHATLHDFQGEARSFTGSAQADLRQPQMVTSAILTIPATYLTTFENTRDTNMKRWLKVETNPQIVFELHEVNPAEKHLAQATEKNPAPFSVKGDLVLNHIRHVVEAPALCWREGSLLVATGKTQIDTTNYGLPEIRQLFLTVSKKVDITFHLAFDLPPDFQSTSPSVK